jgi:hypothetical protein
MDELNDLLHKLMAMVGSDRACWQRIDSFLASYRPKPAGKRRAGLGSSTTYR